MMKLGIYLNSQHRERDDPARRLAETLEQARLVRALGFDSIWAGEHHLVPGFHYFPQLPLLQRIAVEAEGLALGTHVTLLPLHHPVELAEIGAQAEAAIQRAARIGDGWLLVPTPTIEKLAEQMALFRSARSEAKLAPAAHICRLYEVACAADEEVAFRRVAPYLLEKYASYA